MMLENDAQNVKWTLPFSNGWSLFFIAAYLFLTFFIYQNISAGTPVCTNDCVGYVKLMGIKGDAFFQTLSEMYRPWAVPVFFSLFGKYTLPTAVKIMQVQTDIAYAAWIFFAYACQSLFTARVMKLLSFVAVSSLMFGQGYYHFNQFLLSDSLALSSVLVQLSLCLLLPRILRNGLAEPKATFLIFGYIGLLVVVTAVEVATRDANILLALAGGVLALVAARKNVGNRPAKIILGILVLIVCAVQVMNLHTRSQQAMEDIMAAVIFTNDDMRNFFVEHGLPRRYVEAGIRTEPQDLGELDIPRVEANRKIIDELGMPSAAGKYYLAYLRTHPAYVIDNTLRYNHLIFEQNFYPDVPAEGDRSILEGLSEPSSFAFKRWPYLSVADNVPLAIQTPVLGFYALLCCVWFWKRKADIIVLLPIFLAALGASNAIMGFFGEAWERVEMARHAFIGSVLYRIGFVLCVLFLIDEMRRWPFCSLRRCHLGRWTRESQGVPVGMDMSVKGRGRDVDE